MAIFDIGTFEGDRSPSMTPWEALNHLGSANEVTSIEIDQGLTTADLDTRYPPGNVLRYGADPTGVLDSSAAFNLATRDDYHIPEETGIYDKNFNPEVIVPGGEYLLKSTVYVHKGQHLRGAGDGATRFNCDEFIDINAWVFVLGESSLSGAEQYDSGGLAPEISGIWTVGGPDNAGIITCGSAGVTIHNMFITTANNGVRMFSSDGRLTNVQIDLCHTGLIIGGHSHIISNILIYRTWTGIQTYSPNDTNCSDNIFSNIQFYYISQKGIIFNAGLTHMNNTFSNCQFSLNAQYVDFDAFIFMNCDGAKNTVFSDCLFTNMKGPAYKDFNNTGNETSFMDCIFEGNKSVPNYIQGTTAFAAAVGTGKALFQGCQFRHLLAAPVYVDGAAGQVSEITVRGGSVLDCATSYLVLIASGTPTYGSYVIVEGVTYEDQQKQSTSVTTNGWFVGSDSGQVLTGAGTGTRIKPYPCGRNSVYFVDTSTLAAQIFLPIAGSGVIPKHGDKLTFIDYSRNWFDNNVVFEYNDITINGGVVDLPVSTNGLTITFTYNSVTNDWITH
jgi:hypothetical protein